MPALAFEVLVLPDDCKCTMAEGRCQRGTGKHVAGTRGTRRRRKTHHNPSWERGQARARANERGWREEEEEGGEKVEETSVENADREMKKGLEALEASKVFSRLE